MSADREVDVDQVVKDVSSSFSRLIGEFLELSEGFFKEKVELSKWNGFRKLVLDLGNANRRFIVAKLEGRNYYILIPRKGEKDG